MLCIGVHPVSEVRGSVHLIIFTSTKTIQNEMTFIIGNVIFFHVTTIKERIEID